MTRIDDYDFKGLEGKTICRIEGGRGDDVIKLFLAGGDRVELWHMQRCCEDVRVEDIIGDLDDLLHVPIVMAEVVRKEGEELGESATWTFYKLATAKGYVTIRWLGESNGYYSEEVDCTYFMSKQPMSKRLSS